MAANSHGRQLNTRPSYVYGNTARTLDVKKALSEAPTGEPLRAAKSENRKAHKMNMSFVYVLFLLGSMMITGYSLMTYIKLQTAITTKADSIATCETRLNNLTLANDDEYSKMINTVDLDAIRTVAIEKLGMVIPTSNQKITYTRENSDYVRQVNDIKLK